MKKIVVLKVKDLDGLETRFGNTKPLKILPVNYTVFKDEEKRPFHLRPTGNARLLGLILKGMSCISICQSVSFCSEVEYCNFLVRNFVYYKIVKNHNLPVILVNSLKLFRTLDL